MGITQKVVVGALWRGTLEHVVDEGLVALFERGAGWEEFGAAGEARFLSMMSASLIHSAVMTRDELPTAQSTILLSWALARAPREAATRRLRRIFARLTSE